MEVMVACYINRSINFNTSRFFEKKFNQALSFHTIQTVWLTVFMKGDDVKLVERLTTTFSNMLRVLERRGEQEQTPDGREVRTEFAAYALDSLQECLTNLPCSLPEFLETKVMDFLTNAAYAPPSRILCRLLKLILCCCAGFNHTLHIQIIKMLCTSLNSERTGYFFSDSEATSNESPILSHCKRYRIGAEELSIIMSIGAIIVGSLEVLPPNSFNDMLQTAVFTDKFMILAILKYQVPEPASAVLLQSALVCLFYSRFRTDLLWPSLHDVDFYTELTQCLHNIIMDPSEPGSRFLAIRVYDALLEKVAAADNSTGGLRDFILTNPWNGIVLEQLQVVAPQEELLYPSIFLLQFVTALSRTNNLGLISSIEKVSLRVKLRMEAVVGQLTSPMDIFLTQVKPKTLV
ncbi:PEP-CTERM exosortase interaction domain protein [Opisthorchis viverrini]|uniref:PEP-CTERM exosortase interaction domain protein n=1 Tax=Opisthorchis viverrini TaxID=6198 RepID=A0A1S8X9I0_OPIVI|nr:PEP-CTERM exosortase interaction domain protein [Opisthorchis viverrini]